MVQELFLSGRGWIEVDGVKHAVWDIEIHVKPVRVDDEWPMGRAEVSGRCWTDWNGKERTQEEREIGRLASYLAKEMVWPAPDNPLRVLVAVSELRRIGKQGVLEFQVLPMADVNGIVTWFRTSGVGQASSEQPLTLDALRALLGGGTDGAASFTAEGGFRNAPGVN